MDGNLHPPPIGLANGQPAVAKLESQTGMHAFNLRCYAEMIGGTLTITAHVSDDTATITAAREAEEIDVRAFAGKAWRAETSGRARHDD
jgi:hypothetical protein